MFLMIKKVFDLLLKGNLMCLMCLYVHMTYDMTSCNDHELTMFIYDQLLYSFISFHWNQPILRFLTSRALLKKL